MSAHTHTHANECVFRNHAVTYNTVRLFMNSLSNNVRESIEYFHSLVLC